MKETHSRDNKRRRVEIKKWTGQEKLCETENFRKGDQTFCRMRFWPKHGILEMFTHHFLLKVTFTTSIYLSLTNPSMKTTTEVSRLTTFLKSVLGPANHLWPCVAVCWGDASAREGCKVQKQGILTQNNGSVMGYALESVEDHSLMLSCFPLPPLSCRTASLTPDTHRLFLTSVSPPQPLFLSSCPSVTASVFHSSSSCRTSWAHVTSVIKEFLCSALPWKKLLSLLLAVVRLCLDFIRNTNHHYHHHHPQIRSYHCAWHTKTNTPLPTQQESLCLSAVIPGCLFYKTLKVLVMSKLSIFNMIKILKSALPPPPHPVHLYQDFSWGLPPCRYEQLRL